MLKTLIIILLLIQWKNSIAQSLQSTENKPTRIIDSFYIFDFYTHDLHGYNIPGGLGCDNVIVTINNGHPIVLKAVSSKILSKRDFAQRALIDGIKVKTYKGDTTVVNIKATACHNSILTKNRCFDIDTTFYYVSGNETFNYYMPNYTFNDKRFGPVVLKTFFYTNKHELINKRLLSKKKGTKLMTLLMAACNKEYFAIPK